MPDHSSLDAFTPMLVPARHDGWTAARQRTFIRALAETGSVTHAAAEAGVSARSAYRMRARVGAEVFAEAWDQALVAASQALVAIAYERAIVGTPRAVWYKGEQVGEERRPNDRLLMYLLKHLDAARFGRLSGLNAATFTDPRRDADMEVKRLQHMFKDADAEGEG